MINVKSDLCVNKVDVLKGWSKSKGGGVGLEENGGWVSKFRALAKGGSPQFSVSGGVGHDSF